MGLPSWLANLIGYAFGFGLLYLVVGGPRLTRNYLARAREESARHSVVALHATGNPELDAMENDLGYVDAPSTAKPAQASMDLWALWTRYLLFALVIGAVIRSAILWPTMGWWGVANGFTVALLALLAGMVVVYAQHGKDGSFLHTAPRLLAHEIAGLWRYVDRDPERHARHVAHRENIRRKAHEAHQRDLGVIKDREFRQMLQTRMLKGRLVLESALNQAVPLAVVETQKRPHTYWERQKDGSSQRRTEIQEHQVKRTLARVRGRLDGTRAVYDLQWAQVAYDAKIAQAWERLCADATLVLRLALGDLGPDQITYTPHLGVLTVEMIATIVVDFPEEMPPEIEEIDPEPQVDDESPVVLGGPRLDILPAGKHAVGRPTQGKTVSKELIAAINNLLTVQDGATASAVATAVGPTSIAVTVRPPAGVRGSALLKLGQDLEIDLKSSGIRIAPSPDHAGCVLFELAREDDDRDQVSERSVLGSREFRAIAQKAALPVAFGVDGSGRVLVADLASLPHLLVAGATGSGKSVALHSLALSIIATRSPDEVRLVFSDPKFVEFPVYDTSPYVLAPCLSDVDPMYALLQWLVAEMDRRFRLLAKAGVQDIDGYNTKHATKDRMPRIVSIWDEVADLMQAADKNQRAEVQRLMARLLAKARACGIHMVLGTQRPTADVLPGLIKSNAPARWGLMVGSELDSRIILDQSGAETLRPKGDGLVQIPGAKSLVRVQTGFAPREAIEAVLDWCATERGPVQYDPSLVSAVVTALLSSDRKGAADEARAYADKASIGLGGQALGGDNTSPAREAEALGGDHLFGLGNEAEGEDEAEVEEDTEQKSAEANDEGQGTKPPETDDDNGNWFDPD